MRCYSTATVRTSALVYYGALLLASFLGSAAVHGLQLDWESYSITHNFNELLEAIKHRNVLLKEMAEQFTIERFHAEERIRSEGDSGIVQSRNYQDGSQNFYRASHTSTDFANLHDHMGYRNMLGMGEATIVMNGFQFATAHTDFQLVRPSTQTSEFHATEEIVPPEIPESVKDADNVDDQIKEMQEYFRAFKAREPTLRPYEDFFKPVLCYLEGAWLSEREGEELVQSSVTPSGNTDFRGTTWKDLREQMKLQTRTGAFLEGSVPSLPRAILGVDNDGIPQYAQWSYRILCQPFQHSEIRPEHIRLVDDLAYRMAYNKTVEELYYSKGARFILDDGDAPGFHELPTPLDRVVSQIPGVDNGHEVIYESEFFPRKVLKDENGAEINAAFYSRRFSSNDPSYNVPSYLRGFNDANLYTALTRKPQIAPITAKFKVGHRSNVETVDDLRVTYLLPLEIIYLTPLQQWNPLDLLHYEGDPTVSPANAARASGEGSTDKPFNATNEMLFYRTPRTFYGGNKYGPHRVEASDVGIGDQHIMDQTGTMHHVAASGITMVTPSIANDVGPVRLRFPILPVHEEGSGIWKEVNALKALLVQELSRLGRNVRSMASQGSDTEDS